MANKGWHKESKRHSLAARGIETGRKKTQTYGNEKYLETTSDNLFANTTIGEIPVGNALSDLSARYNDPDQGQPVIKEMPGAVLIGFENSDIGIIFRKTPFEVERDDDYSVGEENERWFAYGDISPSFGEYLVDQLEIKGYNAEYRTDVLYGGGLREEAVIVKL